MLIFDFCFQVKVEAALNIGRDHKLLTAFGVTLEGIDIHTLRELGLLNDNVSYFDAEPR